MSSTSPQWSACPCVRKRCVGSTSSGPTAAFGLPLRNGSISTRVSPSLSSKQACPRKRMSMSSVLLSVSFQLECQFPSQRDSYQHPHSRLLREERADRGQALVGVRLGGRLQDLRLIRVLEPAALVECLVQDPLELGGHPGDALLGPAEPLGIAQRLDRRLDLGVRRLALRHAADNRRVERTGPATTAALRLTQLSHGAGCACKLPPGLVHALIADMPRSSDPALLVGHETADDAAVYRVSDELALVSTVDFFTPIVDDPYDFGRVAATNALSDVYAMGGRPLTALNLVAYSLESLGEGPLREILRGGSD